MSTSVKTSGGAPSPWDSDRVRLISRFLFVGLSAATVALIVYWGRYTLFFHDEWGFVMRRVAWNLDSLMSPHNEHWVLGPALIWKVLLEIVGLSTHWPYLLVLALVHVLVAAAIYRFFEREVGSLTALAASAIVLLLGTGGENLFWAFQVGFVGATAAGLWAIVLFIEPTSRRRSVAVAILLMVAIAMSGPGLFFLAAIAAVVVIVPRQRRRFWVLLPAVIIYALWALTYGRGGTESSLAISPDQVESLVAYIRTGVEAAFGSLFGVGPEIGLVLAVILIGATIWNLLSDDPIVEGALAGSAALVTQFAMIGLSRVHLGVEFAGSSRYMYTGAVLALLIVGAWYGARRRSGRPTVGLALAMAALLTLSLVVNVTAMREWRDWFWRRGDEARAAIAIMAEHGGSPGLPMRQSGHNLTDAVLRGLPSAENVEFMEQELGLDIENLPGATRPLNDVVYDRVMFRLVEGAIEQTTGQIFAEERWDRV